MIKLRHHHFAVKIFGTAYTAQYDFRTPRVHVINQQAVKIIKRNIGKMPACLLKHFNTLLHRKAAAFGGIVKHSDHHLIKQRRSTFDQVQMSDRDRIKTSGADGNAAVFCVPSELLV